MAGTFLAEYGRTSKLADVIRFLNDILLSAPSILIGLFVYTLMVRPMGTYSGWAGGVALAIIAIPVIVRTTEDMLRLVPGPCARPARRSARPLRRHHLGDVEGRLGGHRDGHHPGARPHRRRDRAAAVHGAQQQFLVLPQPDGRRREPAGDDLPVRALALSELAGLAWAGALLITGTILVLSIIARLVINPIAPADPRDVRPRDEDMTMNAASVMPTTNPTRGAPAPGRAVRIAVKDLNFYYGSFHGLKNVNLDFYDRQVTALIGPSGCGKSTLLRCFNRIYSLYPDQRAEGQILLDGQNVLDSSVDLNELRSRIGMVFQKPTPFPMSIYDNVAFGCASTRSCPRPSSTCASRNRCASPPCGTR